MIVTASLNLFFDTFGPSIPVFLRSQCIKWCCCLASRRGRRLERRRKQSLQYGKAPDVPADAHAERAESPRAAASIAPPAHRLANPSHIASDESCDRGVVCEGWLQFEHLGKRRSLEYVVVYGRRHNFVVMSFRDASKATRVRLIHVAQHESFAQLEGDVLRIPIRRFMVLTSEHATLPANTKVHVKSAGQAQDPTLENWQGAFNAVVLNKRNASEWARERAGARHIEGARQVGADIPECSGGRRRSVGRRRT